MSAELLSVSQAQKRILNIFFPKEVSEVPLIEAYRRVLATDIIASLNLPVFPNSSMDGFAVKIDDIKQATRDNPIALDVVGDIPAGIFPSISLGNGQAIRIMTGAPIPMGAEAVIPVEDTDFRLRSAAVEAPKSILIYRSAILGENIRAASEDVRSGEVVLKQNHQIRPQDVAFLSMWGLQKYLFMHYPELRSFQRVMSCYRLVLLCSLEEYMRRTLISLLH